MLVTIEEGVFRLCRQNGASFSGGRERISEWRSKSGDGTEWGRGGDSYFHKIPSNYFPATNLKNRVYCVNCHYRLCKLFRQVIDFVKYPIPIPNPCAACSSHARGAIDFRRLQ